MAAVIGLLVKTLLWQQHLSFEVLTHFLIKVFWNMSHFQLIINYPCFREGCCLHLRVVQENKLSHSHINLQIRSY